MSIVWKTARSIKFATDMGPLAVTHDTDTRTLDFETGELGLIIEIGYGEDLLELKKFILALPEEAFEVPVLADVDEPTIPGATVVDAEDRVWVRIPVSTTTTPPWVSTSGSRFWDAIQAVRIVDDGTPA